MSRPAPLLSIAVALALLALPSCRVGARSGRKPADAEPVVAETGRSVAAPPPTARAPAPAPYLGPPPFVTPPTKEEFTIFNRAWALFVRRDPGWPAARDAWLAGGVSARVVLAENLLRFFWSASRVGGRDEVLRVAAEARAVGGPAVPYFADLLGRDAWPLKEPITIRDRDGTERRITEWTNDDMTRQHLALVLAWIGAPAVPALLSAPLLGSATPATRHYACYALGGIATDDAVAALARTSAAAPDWQDRAAAVKGLGYALARNASARPALERALKDPDPFVRRKAREGLDGRLRSEF